MHGYFHNEMQVLPYMAPVFSMTTITNCFRDLVFPAFHMQDDKPIPENQLVPWQQKREALFWRGGTTGAPTSSMETFMESHRPRFIKHATTRASNPDLVPIDAKFSGIPEQFDADWFTSEYGEVGRSPYEEHWKFKYLMVIDGWSFNSRLQTFLSSGSLIFRVGVFDEWFEDYIVPMVHYVPVRLDLSDLDEKLEWARSNDAEARQIAERARELALRLLHPGQHKCFASRLLIEYDALYDKNFAG